MGKHYHAPPSAADRPSVADTCNPGRVAIHVSFRACTWRVPLIPDEAATEKSGDEGTSWGVGNEDLHWPLVPSPEPLKATSPKDVLRDACSLGYWPQKERTCELAPTCPSSLSPTKSK